jgi:hypothetical protein
MKLSVKKGKTYCVYLISFISLNVDNKEQTRLSVQAKKIPKLVIRLDCFPLKLLCWTANTVELL